MRGEVQLSVLVKVYHICTLDMIVRFLFAIYTPDDGVPK